MFQTAQRFNFLLYHLVALLLSLHVQCLDSHKLIIDLILAERDLSEATLAQMLLKLKGVDAHRIIKIVVESIEQTFKLRELSSIIL